MHYEFPNAHQRMQTLCRLGKATIDKPEAGMVGLPPGSANAKKMIPLHNLLFLRNECTFAISDCLG